MTTINNGAINYLKGSMYMEGPSDRQKRVLPLVSDKDPEQLLRLFNDTSAEFPRNKLIHEVFETQVQRSPNEIAVVFGGDCLTYRELNQSANQLARHLRACGVGPDQLVGICLQRGVAMIVGILGVLKSGGAYVPLDPGYPTELLTYMIEDARPIALLTEQSLSGYCARNFKEVVCMDTQWEQLSSYNDSDLERGSFGLTPHNLAYVIYTSGSTGRPKGVMIEHRNVLNLWQGLERIVYREELNCKRVSVNASVAFDSSVKQIVQLLSGRTLVIIPQVKRIDASELINYIAEHRVECFDCTPAQLSHLISAGLLKGDRHVPRIVLIGGEAIDSKLWRKLSSTSEIEFYNVYGPTECTVDATIAAVRESPDNPVIGRPIPNVQIYILDGHRQPVSLGVMGEIYIGGEGVARGYLNQPALTAERFLPHPFSREAEARSIYRTGDLGNWLADGSIVYLGRGDRQVKIRGFRVELGEIEALLAKRMEVREATATVRESVSGDRSIVAYVVVDTQLLKARERASDEACLEFVDQWKQERDKVYSSETISPSFVDWNRSYKERQIPDYEMEEWLQQMLARIRMLRPHSVLEIGCGTGLLLEHLAPSCQVYRATDFSSEAIERLRRWRHTRADLQHVQLDQRSPLELDGLPAGGYDTVLLNSTHYFPDAEYLRAVLERVVKWVAPGGSILVTNVRHLGLQQVFQSSIQLDLASAATTVGQLKKHISHAIAEEKELLIDPRFFVELPNQELGIGGVQVLLKRGQADNELTRYRYDVILSVNESRSNGVIESTVWRAEERPISELARHASLQPLRSVRICGVRNRRIHRDLAAMRLIETNLPSCTVGRLRELLKDVKLEGEDPELLWTLGESNGYETRVSWNVSYDDGSFDVEWIDPTHAIGECAREEPTISINAGIHTNDPLGSCLRRQCSGRLREYLEEQLPAHMVPAAIILLDRFPLTANGKIDREALPLPEEECDSETHIGARTPMEGALCDIWQGLFNRERIGVEANFFELGGHSQLAMTLVERIAERFKIQLSAIAVFHYPTIETMAQVIDVLLSEDQRSAENA